MFLMLIYPFSIYQIFHTLLTDVEHVEASMSFKNVAVGIREHFQAYNKIMEISLCPHIDEHSFKLVDVYLTIKQISRRATVEN